MEHTFSATENIEARFRNRLYDYNLDHLLKICMERPEMSCVPLKKSWNLRHLGGFLEEEETGRGEGAGIKRM